MRRILLGMFLAASGCASVHSLATHPYGVYMRALGPSDFQNDGPDMVFTMVNESSQPATLTMTCYGYPAVRWIERVKARGEVHAIGQLLGKDTHSNPCEVTGEPIAK